LTKIPFPFASALLLAACGRTLATSSVAKTQLAPPDVFRCVMKQFDTLGFQRTMYDTQKLRTNARKVNPKITFSNTQFRKAWDRLEVEVKPGTTGTDLNVVASTVAEYFSQNGQNFNPLPPTKEVQEAARALEQKCGGSGPNPDTTPYAQ